MQARENDDPGDEKSSKGRHEALLGQLPHSSIVLDEKQTERINSNFAVLYVMVQISKYINILRSYYN